MTSCIPVKAVVFLVVMYGCESWTIKKAKCWRIDAFELWCWRRLLSPLDSKEVKPVYPKGNQSWIFIVRADAEAEAPIFWPPDMKNWLIGKDPDAGKDWRQEKGMAENEMVGWHQRLHGHEFEQALGVGDGQGSLVCCSPWVKHDWAIELKWASLSKYLQYIDDQVFYIFWKKDKNILSIWINVFKRNCPCCYSVTKSCPTLCNLVNCSKSIFLVLDHLPEFIQTHVHWVSDAASSHPLPHASPLVLNFPQHQGLFHKSVLCIRWPKNWSFSFSNSPSNEYSGLISFRIDWFDFLAVQGTLKSLFQHHNSKASILKRNYWSNIGAVLLLERETDHISASFVQLQIFQRGPFILLQATFLNRELDEKQFSWCKTYELYVKMRFLTTDDCFTNGEPSCLREKNFSRRLKFLVNNQRNLN